MGNYGANIGELEYPRKTMETMELNYGTQLSVNKLGMQNYGAEKGEVYLVL